MSYFGKVEQPLREVLHNLTGKFPPSFVKDQFFSTELTEEEQEELQWWCFDNSRPEWLTGIDLMDAANALVQGALDNGNIDTQPKKKDKLDEEASELLKTLIECCNCGTYQAENTAIIKKTLEKVFQSGTYAGLETAQKIADKAGNLYSDVAREDLPNRPIKKYAEECQNVCDEIAEEIHFLIEKLKEE